jgi:hypothetical protein
MEKTGTPVPVSPSAALHVKSYGIAGDPSSQAYLWERVAGKLGKFALHIQNLEIKIRQLDWVGNRPQVSCALSVTLDGGATLAIERSALGAREAFDHAMGVAERMIRSTLQRLRHQGE